MTNSAVAARFQEVLEKHVLGVPRVWARPDDTPTPEVLRVGSLITVRFVGDFGAYELGLYKALRDIAKADLEPKGSTCFSLELLRQLEDDGFIEPVYPCVLEFNDTGDKVFARMRNG